MGFWYYCQEKCCGRRVYAWEPSPSPRQYGPASGDHVPTYCLENDYFKSVNGEWGVEQKFDGTGQEGNGDHRLFAPLYGRPHSIDRQSDGWVLLKDGYGIKDDGSLWKITEGGRAEFFDAGPWTWVSAKDGYGVGIKQDQTLWSWGSSSGFPLPGNGEVATWFIDRFPSLSSSGSSFYDQTYPNGFVPRVTVDCSIESFNRDREYYYSTDGLEIVQHQLECYGTDAQLTPYIDGGSVFFIEPPADVVFAKQPIVEFTPPGAKATAILGDDGKVGFIRVDEGGSYSLVPPVTRLLREDGDPVEVTSYIEGPVSVLVHDGGSGYTNPSTSKAWWWARCSRPASAGKVYRSGLTSGGENYFKAYAPQVSFEGTGGGSGAEATATVNENGSVISVSVTNGGSGYKEPFAPSVSISGTGKDAAAMAFVDALGRVSAIRIVNPGRGYGADTKISFSPEGATATPVVEGGRVVGADITSAGSGYFRAKPPTVTFTPTGATAVATVGGSNFAVQSVEVTHSGLYRNPFPPTVSLTSGGGTGATFKCSVNSAGEVDSVWITSCGSGYSNPSFRGENDGENYMAESLGLVFTTTPGATGSGASGSAEVISTHRYIVQEFYGDFSYVGDITLAPGKLSSITLPYPIPVRESGFEGVTSLDNNIAGGFRFAEGWRVSDCNGELTSPLQSPHATGGKYEHRFAYTRRIGFVVTDGGSGYDETATVTLSGSLWGDFSASAGLGLARDADKSEVWGATGVTGISVSGPIDANKYTALLLPPLPYTAHKPYSLAVAAEYVSPEDKHIPSLIAYPTDQGNRGALLSVDTNENGGVSSISVRAGGGGHADTGPITIAGSHAMYTITDVAAKAHYHCRRSPPLFTQPTLHNPTNALTGSGMYLHAVISTKDSVDPHFETCSVSPKPKCWYISELQVWDGGEGYANGGTVRWYAINGTREGEATYGEASLSVKDGAVTSAKITQHLCAYRNTGAIESVVVDSPGSYRSYYPQRTDVSLPTVKISAPADKSQTLPARQATAVAKWLDPAYTYEHDVNGTSFDPVLEATTLAFNSSGSGLIGVRHYYRFPHTGSSGLLHPYETIRESAVFDYDRVALGLTFDVADEIVTEDGKYRYPFRVIGVPVGPEVVSVNPEIVVERLFNRYVNGFGFFQEVSIPHSVITPATVVLSRSHTGGAILPDNDGVVEFDNPLAPEPFTSLNTLTEAYVLLTTSPPYVTEVYQDKATGSWHQPCKALHTSAFAAPDADLLGKAATPATFAPTLEDINGIAHVTGFQITNGGAGYTYEPRVIYEASKYGYAGGGQAIRLLDRPTKISDDTGWVSVEFMGDRSFVAAVREGNVYWWGFQGRLEGATDGKPPVASSPIRLGSSLEIRSDEQKLASQDLADSTKVEFSYPQDGIIPARLSLPFYPWSTRFIMATDASWMDPYLPPHNFAPGPAAVATNISYGYLPEPTVTHHPPDVDKCKFTAVSVGPDGSASRVVRAVGGFCVLTTSGEAWTLSGSPSSWVINPTGSVSLVTLSSEGAGSVDEYRWRITTMSGGSGYGSDSQAVITTTNYSLVDVDGYPTWQLSANESLSAKAGEGGRFFGPSGVVTSHDAPTVTVTGSGTGASFDISKLQDTDRFSSGWVRLGEPALGGWDDIHPPLIGISKSAGVRRGIAGGFFVPAGIPCDGFVSLAPGSGDAGVITASNDSGDIYATDAMSAWIENEIELKLTNTGSGMTMPPRAELSQANKSIAHVDAKINGRVVAFGMTRKGSGYSVQPEVTVDPPSAKGIAHICGPVEVEVDASGAGYRVAPKVQFKLKYPSEASQQQNAGTQVIQRKDGAGAWAETAGIPAEATLSVSGVIDSVSLSNGGSRYSEPPGVMVVGDGSGAKVLASISGYVDEVVMTSGGSGYESAPDVSIPGCKAVAVVRGGYVEKVIVTDPGSGFATPPTVTFSGGNPKATATAVAVLNAGVSSLTLQNPGSGYTQPPLLQFSSGDASAHCTMSLGVSGASVTKGGRYFNSPPPATVDADWCISKIAIDNAGGGYQSAPDVLIVGGSGRGAAASCSIHGPLTKATVVSGGIGYSSDFPPYVVVEGGLDPVVGVHATASAVVENGSVSKITIDTPGSGYSSPPTIAIRYPEPATAVAEVDGGQVTHIKVVNRGAFYAGTPEILLTGGSASRAARASATVADGSVVSIEVTDSGAGYVQPPDVYIVYDRYGEGASVVSEIDGVVDSISLHSGGSGYVLPPKVLFVGGGGDGASATATATQEGMGAELSCKINGRVEYIELTDHGNGYETSPAVSIGAPDLPNGTQSHAQARILGRVESFNVVNGGYGYSGDTVRAMVNGVGYSRDRANYAGDPFPGNKPYAAKLPTAGGAVSGEAIVKPIQDYVTAPQVYIEDELGVRPLATMSLVSLGVDHLGQSATSSSRPALPYSSHMSYVAPPGSRRGATAFFSYRDGFVASQTGAGTTQAIRPAYVDGVVVTNPGSGYESPPTVSLPFGKATASLSGGSVESVTVTDAGSFADFQADTSSDDYLLDSLRKASFSGGGSWDQATGYITVGYDDTRCRILRIVVTDPGDGYTSAPSVTVTPGPCEATASISGGGVSSILITANGYYSASPTVTITGGGSGVTRVAKAEAVLGGEAREPPTGSYRRPPYLDISMSWRGTLAETQHSIGDVWLSDCDEFVIHNETGSMAGFTVPSIGDTSSQPVLYVSGGVDYSTRYESGDRYLVAYGGVSLAYANEATAFATISDGAVTGIGVTNGGKWFYKSEPVVYISGGGGTGATATAIVQSGVITSIRVDSPGSGYKTAPLVTIVDKYPYYESIDIDLPLPQPNNSVPRLGHSHPFVVGGRLAFVDIENAGVPVDAESIDMFAVFSDIFGEGGGHASVASLHPFFEDVSVVDVRIVHDMIGGRTAKALKHQHEEAPEVTFSFTAPATPDVEQTLPEASTTIVKWHPPVADGVAIRDVDSEST